MIVRLMNALATKLSSTQDDSWLREKLREARLRVIELEVRCRRVDALTIRVRDLEHSLSELVRVARGDGREAKSHEDQLVMRDAVFVLSRKIEN